jgi:hypothetical protein
MSEMRQAIDEFRYRWLNVRIGGPDATLRGQWVVLSVSLLVVFACFFAVGRLRSGGGSTSPSAAPSALVAPSGQPAVPTGLSGGSPIAGAVPVAIAVKPRSRSASQPVASADLRAVTPAQSFTAQVARSETPAAESQPVGARREAAPEPPPAKVSAPAQNGGASGSSGQSPTKGASQSSSGGFSFDTSE